MNKEFQKALVGLNKAQRTAVEQIEGPLLVIAGPGTGKTQLLSARVAHILTATDTLPQNILCLTFTESGASNMRDRLTRFIGPDAYHVTIGTYHAFGGNLIRQFPEYFAETRLQEPVDELGKRQIVDKIVEAMSYRNPLKSTQYHLHDLLTTISEVKRGLLDEQTLRALAAENLHFISKGSDFVHSIFKNFTSMPRKASQAIQLFEALHTKLQTLEPSIKAHSAFNSLASSAVFELDQALAAARSDNSTKPLTAWKNTWLAKNTDNTFILTGELQNRRIEALADVFLQYQTALQERGLYDFDDMILRSIRALETHADLRFSLQEQYLYLLLDEFQDTNAAQLKLIQLLTNNPISEGRPNVMAVGDDDQAIYSFQGAEFSNMLDFFHMYRDVQVVNLTENYRSHPDILHIAHQVADQINDRLTHQFENMSKVLLAANQNLTTEAHIDRHEFLSDVAEYSWIATQIAGLIKRGVQPLEIAVLAPRHKQLEPLVAFLNDLEVPVRYEKRENILETSGVQQLLTMSRLILALQAENETIASSLWPEVLSYEFWQLPTSAIWQLSWRVQDSHGEQTWTRVGLDDETFRMPVLFMLTLAHQVAHESCETILDYLIGNTSLKTQEQDVPTVTSPLREFYLGKNKSDTQPELFYETLSHLTVLRTKLREHQATQERALLLNDLVAFVELYQTAGERMLNTSPYNQHADAVQLMTVFKAKGLEFEHVFLPSCQDEVWGESSRSNSNRLTLPVNLSPIRHAGTTADERLRIFFVALTRAKLGLHLTSCLQTYSGKTTKRLQYLHEQAQADGGFKSLVLPLKNQIVRRVEAEVPTMHILELNWHSRHLAELSTIQLRDLLSERLAHYQLSPTHLNTFTDMVYSGPETFFFGTILRFPSAPTSDGQFGNAIHETLQWIQQQVDQHTSFPEPKHIIKYFINRMLAKRLAPAETERLIERGTEALNTYIIQRKHSFTPGHKAEYNFRNEGVFIGDVHMSGKIDRMEIDRSNKTITVIDYKTGASFSRWTSDLKLHKFRQQLYCYKLLIEHSHSFRDYKVNSARVEFIEPDANGSIQSLELTFNDQDLEATKLLLAAMWRCVKSVHLPDISGYDTSLTGTRRFEADLINGVFDVPSQIVE